MKTNVKIALAALAVMTAAGCASTDDGGYVVTSTSVGGPYGETVVRYRETYVPKDGTDPYRGVDPYRNNSRSGPVNPE
jgi:hypothetical protein